MLAHTPSTLCSAVNKIPFFFSLAKILPRHGTFALSCPNATLLSLVCTLSLLRKSGASHLFSTADPVIFGCILCFSDSSQSESPSQPSEADIKDQPENGKFLPAAPALGY